MSNYRRLISYIYAYEGGIKGKNIGFAKIEARNGQCKIQVNVKKVYVGSSDLGVYLLAGKTEILLGKIFIRNGAGEFRTSVLVSNVENSGQTMDECYGLTIHSIEDAWQSYTTIWEDAAVQAGAETQEDEGLVTHAAEIVQPENDAVQRAAEIDLCEVTAENREEEEIRRELGTMSPQIKEAETTVQEMTGLRKNSIVDEIEREIQTQKEIDNKGNISFDWNLDQRSAAADSMKAEQQPLPEVYRASEEQQRTEVYRASEQQPLPVEYQVSEQQPSEVCQAAEQRPSERYQASEQPQTAETRPPSSQQPQIVKQMPQEPIGNPKLLEQFEQEEQEESQPDKLWQHFRKTYPKIQAFDYNNGCEILTIKPQDIGLLPREIWTYGNNSFLLHGYYNYRYLILAKLNNPTGAPRYLLGVPGHYYSNEKYMATMFGFPDFVLSKMQPAGDGRFGYWYTDINMGNQ